MSRKVQYMMLLSLALGLVIFTLSSIFRNYLTDFQLGFCEGVSIVFLVVGFIYMGWCFINKKNPYKIKNNGKKE